MTGGPGVEVTLATALAGVDADAWDALAGADDPFVEHAFLSWLEEAGCVGERSGWRPHHLLVWEVRGDRRRLVGAAPTYLKDNSYGEYIFDWGWADASMRAGIPYYPKLVVAVPFTPATGPRLLVHPEADGAAVRGALAAGARALADELGASSIHWLFTPPDEARALEALGFLRRQTHQYHWHDEGYGDFEGFLAALRAKRRKEIRRERREAAASGLTFAVEPADALSEADLLHLYACYRTTIDDHGQIPYLTRRWWLGLGRRLGHRAIVVTARRDGALVAGALAFHKGRHLFGRYWGALEDLKAVHFECCYYQLVAWALAHGITRVEAGAQGPHKIPRGFLPSATWSAHWLRHPGLHDAVARFVAQEAARADALMDAYAEASPFHRDGG